MRHLPASWLPVLSLASAFAVGTAACGGDPPASQPCSGATCSDMSMLVARPDMTALPPPDLSGARNTHFIINKLLMPDPSTPALEFKYDVDGSGRQRNQLGLVLNALKNLGGTDPQLTVDDSLAMGEVIQLLQLTSTDPDLVTDTQMALSGWVGSAPPGTMGDVLFSGMATVDVVVAEEPKEHLMVGAIASGKVSTGYQPPAALPLHFPLPGQPPVPLTIYGVHIEGTISTRMTGGFNLGAPRTGSWAMLSGGISATQIHERLIPAVAKLLQSYVDMGGQQGMSVASFFDTNKDGEITAEEVEKNPTVENLLAPDEDLFLDADGTLAPNQDKKRDSLSFGLGFTAVPVMFPDQD